VYETTSEVVYDVDDDDDDDEDDDPPPPPFSPALA